MTCPQCLREVSKLTRDHVVPKWFIRALKELGLEAPVSQYSKICADCNLTKGSKLDFSDTQTRHHLKAIIDRYENPDRVVTLKVRHEQ